MRYNVMEVSVRLIRKMIETGDTLPLDGARGRDSDDGSGEDAGDFHGCGEGKGGGGDQSCDMLLMTRPHRCRPTCCEDLFLWGGLTT